MQTLQLHSDVVPPATGVQVAAQQGEGAAARALFGVARGEPGLRGSRAEERLLLVALQPLRGNGVLLAASRHVAQALEVGRG